MNSKTIMTDTMNTLTWRNVMNQTFPVRFKASAHAISELELSEYGSYEDHIQGDERLDEYADGKLHIVEIVQRHKTVIVMENQAELDEVFLQASSGTWSLHCLPTAIRLYKTLKPLVSEKAKEHWVYSRPGLGY